MIPALERLGHDVVALPTVVLSSHAAYPHVAGTPVDPATLDKMANALEANGWLSSVDIIITGYLPTTAHVAVAAGLVQRVRKLSPAMRYICDPVLGDDPKGPYLPLETANALRDELLPLADIATPNAFELAWLTGHPTSSIESAIRAARTLRPPLILATSIPAANHHLATLLVDPTSAHATSSPQRAKAPSGTGDLLTALFAGHLASSKTPPEALAHASAWLERCLDVSTGSNDLNQAPLYASPPSPLLLLTA
jgi:pyridoxine kinase